MAQFCERHRGGAALADDHCGRGVRRTHGELVGSPHRQQHGHHRGHGVAGARNVAHLNLMSRHVDRRVPFHVQTHALFAPRHQYGFAADHAGEFGSGAGDLRLGRERAMNGGR